MSKLPASWRVILFFVFCCVLSGCMPITQTPVDEEKDPNFIEGRNHLNMMDYKGAVESFERAVQANPRNAAAHFELGILYQERMNDPLSAAYHYQKHLQLRPKSVYAEAVKPRLAGCKMEVAKSFNPIVVGGEVHRDLARLTNELTLARNHNETLRAQLAAKPTVLTQWMKFTVTNTVPIYIQPTNAVQQPAPRTVTANNVTQAPRAIATNSVTQAPRPEVARTNTGARVTPLPPVTSTSTISGRRMEQRASANARTRTPAPQETRATMPQTARTRSHVVRAGDTMSNVARRYGVSLQRLQAANPSLDARKLRSGQVLNIPSQ